MLQGRWGGGLPGRRGSEFGGIGCAAGVSFAVLPASPQGAEAANVTGPGGVPVKGSRYAPNRRRFRRFIPRPRPAAPPPMVAEAPSGGAEPGSEGERVEDSGQRPRRRRPPPFFYRRRFVRGPRPPSQQQPIEVGVPGMWRLLPHPGEGWTQTSGSPGNGSRCLGPGCCRPSPTPPGLCVLLGHRRGRVQRDSPIGGGPARR